MIRKFDNSHSPVARYDFDGNLLDLSGNGLHLTGTSPTFREVWGDGTLGLCAGTAARTVTDTLLSLSGDVTVLLLLVLRAVPAAAEIVRFAGPSDPQNTNYQYSIALSSQDQARWLTEHGLGVNDDFFCPPSGINVPSLPALGVPCLLAATRKSNVVQFYLNGVAWGSPSATLTTPDGGSIAKLELKASGSNFPDLFGLKICPSALTPAEHKEQYNSTLGPEFGELETIVQSLWVGALTDQGATVVCKLTHASDAVVLAVTGPSGTIRTSPVATVGTTNVAALVVSGLSTDTEYFYTIESDGAAIAGPTGRFRTAPSGNASFTFAFAGDASNASNHVVFEAIRDEDPLFFIHLGDAHYSDIATNSPALFEAAYDELLSSPRQSVLYAEIPTVYCWDDHDYGGNNSNGSSPSRPAAAAAYRARVPHYTLADSSPTGGIQHSFDIGDHVRIIVTDERSYASANSATDNSSKTMLGSAQKTWFKDLLSNSSDRLIVWVCSRTFGGLTSAGADHWGGFVTERAELVAHAHAHCPGRLVVLSADMHALGIDDGSHHDFLSGGGEPLPTFQAAPLDRTPDATVYGGATYSEGWFNANGQYGLMTVDDAGGPTVHVTWRGYDSAGSLLVTRAFDVTL